MDLSVVIPLRNEKENITILYSKLKKVLASLGKSYEIILVDDHSTDSTFNEIKRLQGQDKSIIRIIHFKKNYGQTAALQSGFDIAAGDIIVTMDGDLQNDPDDIPKLLEKMDEGYDVVSGWRTNRKDPLSKIIPSRVYNYLVRRITGLEIHDFGCSLKAYKRETLKDIELHGEMHRYLLALIAINGFSIGEVEVKHNPRIYGRSKYGLGRLLKGLLDFIYIALRKSMGGLLPESVTKRKRTYDLILVS